MFEAGILPIRKRCSDGRDLIIWRNNTAAGTVDPQLSFGLPQSAFCPLDGELQLPRIQLEKDLSDLDFLPQFSVHGRDKPAYFVTDPHLVGGYQAARKVNHPLDRNPLGS
jgi:hypothetical protein